MIHIEGYYYDGQSSAAHQANLTIEANSIVLSYNNITTQLPVDQLNFSQPIGNITRSVSWQVGRNMASFQTNDILIFDQWYGTYNKHKTAKFIHFLEKHIWAAVFAFIISIFAIYIYVVFGVPALSRVVAQYVPLGLYEYTSQKTLELMDETIFDPTEVSEIDQKRITKKFDALVTDLDWPTGFKLHFRALGDDGKLPNAFALPSGLIVVTDGLIDLADNDAEILSVLAHEVGHVVERHGITAVIEASVLTLSITFISGELSGTSEILINNGVMLTQMSYGRTLEKQADIFGKHLMIEKSVGGAQLLVNMLNKMSKYYGQNPDEQNDLFSGYLSSHPMTYERTKYLLEENDSISN